MIGWYTYALMSLVCYGLQGFLYKVSAKKECDTAWTMFFFMSTVSILAAGSFFWVGEKGGEMVPFLILSVLNAIFFFIVTMASMEALKYVPTNVFYPIMRSSVVLVILFSVLYIGERPSIIQGLGMAISLFVIVFLSGKREREMIPKTDYGRAIVLIPIAFLAGAVVTVVIKYASDLDARYAFIVFSYGINAVLSFLLLDKLQGENEPPPSVPPKERSSIGNRSPSRHRRNSISRITNRDKRKPMIIGVAIGIVNFLGFVTLLRAFASGPLSIAATLIGMAFVIPIVLSFIIYKERITLPRVAAILLAIGATVLLGL